MGAVAGLQDVHYRSDQRVDKVNKVDAHQQSEDAVCQLHVVGVVRSSL